PPPRYEITTDNAVQSFEVRLLPGAPGDMIAQQTLEPVGLAPILYIQGALRGSFEANGRIEVAATGPDLRKQQVLLDDQGRFEIRASHGTWLIETLDREVG